MRTQIKICGLKSEAAMMVAVGLEVDYVGFVFVPSSPRAVDINLVGRLASRLPVNIKRVGIFRDRSPAEVALIARQCCLDVVQLHGEEDVRSYIGAGDWQVWKAVCLRYEADVRRAAANPADLVLVDGAAAGSGRQANWPLAALLSGRRSIGLAGGLDADNVTDAVRQVRPRLVDVSSGVERAPGIKDPLLIMRFVSAVRELEQADAHG